MDKLVAAPKRKSAETGKSIQKKARGDKEDEVKNICNWCKYREVPEEKDSSVKLCAVKNFQAGFKEFATKFATVHSQPKPK